MADYKEFFDLEEIISSVKEYLPNFDSKRFAAAFDFAEMAHNGQMRKDGKTPYITHPVEVVKILITLHADEDTLISALLHDVPEDTPHDIREIKGQFGETVAFLVDGITKLSKVYYKNNMPELQVESLKKLLLHSAEDLRVIFIKLADRLHNMKTLQNIDKPEKRERISKETLEIYVPIANLLGIREIKSQLENLCFMYLYPAEYEEFREKIKSYFKKQEENRDKFTSAIREGFKKAGIDAKISGRKKHLYAIYKKIEADGRSVNAIDNRIAIKIVVKDVPTCYQALGIVHGKFVPNTEKFRDYIANPKINGYQSLHTSVFGVDGLLTEVQIRTHKMDIEAEYGLASAFFDKERPKDVFSAYLKKSSWVKKILEIEKDDAGSENFMENLKHDVLQDRIFVFTPKGEPIDLPDGASVVDFAYAIHSDIGNHVVKANINGKSQPISAILHNSDVVDLITSRKVWPELSWLSFTKTNLAKNKILAYLKRTTREKKISKGHKILQKEFDIAGLGMCEDVNFKKLSSRLGHEHDKHFDSLNGLFESIGEGNIWVHDVVKAVEKNRRTSEAKKHEGLKITIKIVAVNRFKLMRDVADILYKYALDMYTFKGWAAKQDKYAYFTSRFLVEDLETVSHIFDEMEQIEEVRHIYRISPHVMFLFWIFAILGASGWIFHPFILRLTSTQKFQVEHPLIHSTLIYVFFLLLFMIFFYMMNLLKKYFPMIRNKKLVWASIFFVPIGAIFVLGMEMIYFDLNLNWIVLATEIFVVYMYLYFNYRNFRRSIN
ncbi:bifunctional (p)ppGpp synthetase/guanosine-3',5'-bis(diphosphate) 3'-pyrophosphohydrolase [Candidatus Peregrinibacteria bacterium]|nr:bifunctional (p)ppGpp synthetase/guanosine-3',5'-bis(diphosphate) 3'-pyrophosphohydrolase [Candidatus Peregrinibacteria bacterium]